MNKGGKYKASGIESEFEPGSCGKVLKNLLGIKIQPELDRVEFIALKQAEDKFQKLVHKDKHLTAENICNMHKMWLGKIYEWAGKYRLIDLEKKDIRFAHAQHISTLMDDFEKNFLRRHTPCTFNSKERIIEALAEVHVELIVIHPFREGNGRTIRLFLDLLSVHAKYNPIDWSKASHKEYINACIQGIASNHKGMSHIISKGLIKQR